MWATCPLSRVLRSLIRWAPFLPEEIAGEDVVEEEPIQEGVSIGGDLIGYEDEARSICAGAFSADRGEETLAE